MTSAKGNAPSAQTTAGTGAGARVAALLTCLVATGCYDGAAGRGGDDDGGAQTPGALGGADAGGDDDDDDGDDDDDDASGLDTCSGDLPQVTARALQRLTPRQYANTLRDLFGDADFEPSYDDYELIPTLAGVRQLRNDAEAILARRDQWSATVFPCDVEGERDDACAASFVDDFGAKAYRRPLSEDEAGAFVALYHDVADELSFLDAMEVTTAAILQAPEFLYLVEVGEPIDGAPDHLRRLTGHEVASRLSYLLWDTMPDEVLREAAAAGELDTRDGVHEHAERMLADARAEQVVQDFVWSWLQLDGGQLHHALEDSTKDAELFPEYGPPLQDAMRTELEALVRDVVLESPESSLEELLTTNRAYVNGPLAGLYGVAGPADADTWEWVDLDPEQRAGMLTRAAFLTVFASDNVHSPIRRGVFVIEEMLCTELGDPPPDVDDSPIDGEVDEGEGVEVMTIREEVIARTSDAACSGCHSIVNPAGFPFEHYDAIGRWQDVELGSGLPIDASGELKIGDTAGEVDDAVELSNALGGGTQVRNCMAGRWLYRATATNPSDVGECDTEEVFTRFEESGNVRELLVAAIVSDAFRFLDTGEGEGE